MCVLVPPSLAQSISKLFEFCQSYWWKKNYLIVVVIIIYLIMREVKYLFIYLSHLYILSYKLPTLIPCPFCWVVHFFPLLIYKWSFYVYKMLWKCFLSLSFAFSHFNGTLDFRSQVNLFWFLGFVTYIQRAYSTKIFLKILPYFLLVLLWFFLQLNFLTSGIYFHMRSEIWILLYFDLHGCLVILIPFIK